MNTSEDNKPATRNIDDFYLPDEGQIKKLRTIINAESGFKFTYQETEEVSYQLLMLYEELARGRQIVAKESGDGIGE